MLAFAVFSTVQRAMTRRLATWQTVCQTDDSASHLASPAPLEAGFRLMIMFSDWFGTDEKLINIVCSQKLVRRANNY